MHGDARGGPQGRPWFGKRKSKPRAPPLHSPSSNRGRRGRGRSKTGPRGLLARRGEWGRDLDSGARGHSDGAPGSGTRKPLAAHQQVDGEADGGPHGDGAFVSLKMEDSATCGNTGEPGGRHMEGNPPGQERRGSPRASTAAIRIRSEGSKRHRPSLSPLRPGGRLRRPSTLVKSGLSGRRIPGDRRVHTQQPREARGARRPQM